MGAPFSPLVRERIQRDISANVEAQLKPRLNLLVGLVIPGYLQSVTGYGDTLRIGGVRHDPNQVSFTVTGRSQRPAASDSLPGDRRDAPAWRADLAGEGLECGGERERAKKCEAAAKAQAEQDAKLSAKYSAEKPGKNAQTGSDKEKEKGK